MFEYMLKEENLPNVVKALLSRLHTPLLKVAVLDRNFFTQAQHPARKLLNDMAAAGRRWVEETNIERGIFPKMKEIVDRLLVEFEEDVGIFDSLLQEFSKSVTELQQRARLVEHRNAEAAEGQDKLQAARARALSLQRGVFPIILEVDPDDPVAISEAVISAVSDGKGDLGLSDDDAIVLKSTSERPCKNVTISNCLVSANASGIKFGTESGGGFQNVAIDEKYDEFTRNAVESIQAKYGIPVDGYVGPLTKIILYREKDSFRMPRLYTSR